MQHIGPLDLGLYVHTCTEISASHAHEEPLPSLMQRLHAASSEASGPERTMSCVGVST